MQDSNEYKESWDRRYESIKTGGVVYLMNYMSITESKEAFRQLFSRLVCDVDSMRKELQQIKGQNHDTRTNL